LAYHTEDGTEDKDRKIKDRNMKSSGNLSHQAAANPLGDVLVSYLPIPNFPVSIPLLLD
jgi:hypothetical protein